MMENPNIYQSYSKDEMMSHSIAKLALALSKAQSEMKPALKDCQNPFFKSKYADLSSIWESAREPLAKNDLAVIQTTSEDHEFVKLVTTLVHSSGEWIRGTLTMKPIKNDPQGVGSALTYARRYGLAAIVGVCTDDDDGEGSHGRAPKNKEDSTPYKNQTAIETPSQILTFLTVNKVYSEMFGPDGYKEFIRNGAGESPTLAQIETWKTKAQLTWLQRTADKMQEMIVQKRSEPTVAGLND